MVITLTAEQYFTIFSYLFLPMLVFSLSVYITIILSNRMGGKNKLIVFFVRLITIPILILALFFYFYYFVNVLLL